MVWDVALLAALAEPAACGAREDGSARPATVWRYWTDAALIRRWWSPEHFSAVECEAKAVPGGQLCIIMAEGDATRHRAVGRYLTLERPGALWFELGQARRPDSRRRVGDRRACAPGWKQLLDKLARESTRTRRAASR